MGNLVTARYLGPVTHKTTLNHYISTVKFFFAVVVGMR